MCPVIRSCLALIMMMLASPAMAQHRHSSSFASYTGHGGGHSVVMSGHGGPSHGYSGYGLGAVGSGYGSFGYGYGLNYGYGYYPAPLIFVSPIPMQAFPFAQARGGLMLPMPPQNLVNPNLNQPQPRRANPSRAKEMTDIGDRSFRAGNTKRAEEKFNLATKADPTATAPHVHLAQVSLARGDYAAAADHLRNAVTVAVNNEWLINTPDIQAIFAEPRDFAKQIARLESHLQANPSDRDAWFVLGAEYYLSGRSKLASDAFQRLTDRRPDEALAAFLDASNTKMPAPAPAANN